MALVLLDRVQQTGTANTTVSFTLSGTVTGFQSFAGIGNGNTTFYEGTDASGNWETGVGTYSTTGPTLTRTTILASSNAGSAVTFTGTVNVFVTYPSSKSINYDANGVAVIGEALGYSDTGIVASFASTVAGYNQVILQNKSTSTSASANLNVSNNASTASTGFAELGINSTTFSNGSGCFNIPGASYLASADTDLSIGTYGAYNIHFATNSNTTDSMTIFNDGGMSLGGFGDPGLGSMAGNKFVPGYTSITAAAGTTILTSASTYYQRLVGTAIQTIQLPDATTCLVGTTFIFDNDSTGVLTITDGATSAIDTIPSGGIDYIYLISNGTVAGTWARYALLPSSYDFSGSTANFGTASITNATWTGNTIATGYGGTGLTTFTGANNAIYSTSSSALAAGTLPVAAGGTGVTTSTGTGSVVLSTRPTISVTGSGFTLQDATDNTKQANFDLSGLTTGTTYSYTLPALSGAALATLGNITQTFTGFTTLNNGANINGTFSWASASGTYTAGLTTSTGTMTFGQSTVSQTVNISNGATASGSTNTIAIGASGLTGSTTAITIGGGVGSSTTTMGGAVTATGNVSFNGGGGVTTTIGNTTTTGTITLGRSTVSQTVNVSNGVTASGSTNTINIGASGAAGSTTNIAIGSTAGTSTTTLNGNVSFANTVTAPNLVASNGMIVNSNTVSVSYSIPSGSSAIGAGPITVASGVTVTIPSGSRWVVL